MAWSAASEGRGSRLPQVQRLHRNVMHPRPEVCACCAMRTLIWLLEAANSGNFMTMHMCTIGCLSTTSATNVGEDKDGDKPGGRQASAARSSTGSTMPVSRRRRPRGIGASRLHHIDGNGVRTVIVESAERFALQDADRRAARTAGGSATSMSGATQAMPIRRRWSACFPKAIPEGCGMR